MTRPELVGAYLERSVGETLDVSFPERTIEVVVIPYEREAEVMVEDVAIIESIARGAFNGVERRAKRIRVNREHDRHTTFGHCVALYPKREEGLVARMSVVENDYGDRQLELAAHGDLDASAGFVPKAIEHRGGNRFRYTRCWLHHIALTSEAAYEGARVLSVRSATPVNASTPRPNLDRVRWDILEERYSRI